MKLPHSSAHPCGSQHQNVLREYSSFTELLSYVSNLPTVARMSSLPNGNYSATRNIKVRSVPAASAPGLPAAPIQLWQSAAWVVSSGRHRKGHRRPGDTRCKQRMPYCVLTPKCVAIIGQHGVYSSPATAPCPKSV